MKVFKFGGASVRDAQNVKNVAKIIQKEASNEAVIIISAMGKMTNAFEKIVAAFYDNKKDIQQSIQYVYNYHIDIANNLFKKEHSIFTEIEILFGKLRIFLAEKTTDNYDYLYDQIVPFGELLSTKIVSAYLQSNTIENQWIDVRNFIKTDRSFRGATVNWQLTEDIIKAKIDTKKLTVTQGFLGGNESQTTTLGREGSDYTAAIFAYCLNAKSVTIWKDVQGVLNADPRAFKDTQLLTHISYKEAIEMAFYGASVIHPKTLKPLENKLIPLFVRSFNELSNTGTIVSKGEAITPKMACFILKENQYLLSISAKDFSFMVEHNIGDIFKSFGKHQLKVNLIQNSALSFSVCLEDKFGNFQKFLEEIQQKYTVHYNANVKLFTIRHFNQKAIERIAKSGTVLLTQQSRETTQIVLK